ncbi:MAG: hypothetical protein NDJ89_10875 [Oligoflexia bacterium]|nr:hypothetical protein [Oligoflexia bacterium]
MKNRGAVSIPLLLALGILLAASFGTWSVLRQWRETMELQLRLDRCTAEAALRLRDTINSVLAANREIAALRVSIQAAALTPALIPALETALLLEVARQDFLRKRWDLHRVSWFSRVSCGDFSDQPFPLPALDWVRPPPDPVGPRGLHWVGKMPVEFLVQVRHSHRHAMARIFESAAEGVTPDAPADEGANHGKWSAEWTTATKQVPTAL